jgi:hypothetical protein
MVSLHDQDGVRKQYIDQGGVGHQGPFRLRLLAQRFNTAPAQGFPQMLAEALEQAQIGKKIRPTVSACRTPKW